MSDPRSPPPSNPPSPPRPSNPGNLRVITATRAAPLPEEKRPLKERVRGEATNLGLNALAIVREAWADFRASDRYFKFKALIVASWAVLSVAGFAVAFSGQTGALFPNNHLGGRVIVHREPDRTVLLIRNDSDAPWSDVVVIVNHQFRTAKGAVKAHGMFSITPKQLLGDQNQLAPMELTVTDVELRTSRGHAVLLKDGRAP